MVNYLFTSESVTEGHPDKLADQISDAILDEVLKQDPDGKVACEVLLTTGTVIVAGEISTAASLDIQKIVRKTLLDVGYTDNRYGIDGASCTILNLVDKQSQDIAAAVSENLLETGAGDQGIMFGFAVNETKELMPMPIMLSHQITKRLTDVRKSGEVSFLRPDGKAQITVEYKNGKPVRVDTIIISCQHDEDIAQEDIHKAIMQKVILPIIPELLMDDQTIIKINPSGRFVVGGPHGDTGLTGRKIIVDTYGGYSRSGGGAFSGKDYTKVDRSASYAARYLAKNIVQSGIAQKCEIQLAYSIGVAQPVSIYVETFETGVVVDEEIIKAIQRNFDLSPDGIVKLLDLKQPKYKETAAYGHFGNNHYTWEKVDQTAVFEALKK